MYVRQFGYTIMAGYEEKAVALCVGLAEALRGRGVGAHVLVGGEGDVTLQMVEEYPSLEAMQATRASLDRDETYRGALVYWATQFYPLVHGAIPSIVLHDRLAA